MKGTSDEIVVLGAHLDSINGATGRSPGSDDNASGSSTVIEAASAIMNSSFIPKKTIEFQHYAAVLYFIKTKGGSRTS
jgi:bacterial leucyl aminopeptidase